MWEKNLVGKIFVGKKKTCWENNFCKKKNYWKKIYWGKKLSQFILSESGGCDKHDLICIFVYQMGRLCGGAHEISDIKAPLFLHGWVVWWVVCCKEWGEWWVGGGGKGVAGRVVFVD